MGIASTERRERTAQQFARAAVLCVGTFGAEELETSRPPFEKIQALQPRSQQAIRFAKWMRHQADAALLLNFFKGRFEIARLDVFSQKQSNEMTAIRQGFFLANDDL